MRARTAIVGVGIAILALAGATAPAYAIDTPDTPGQTQLGPQGRPGYDLIARYWNERACRDAGYQFKREHVLVDFYCDTDPITPPYRLWGKPWPK
ncbi:hypothetical protein [Nocardia sp. NPDC052566]|uniref:hypothetical protein n=1 Tax=Nocardia sp. NPDC052566 TaxID=3364330 RepID=UPI0037C72D13